uniref:CMRF35-like molecule 7 n=1 Tax=Gouania willdenowi TaxID=441366 RepID=A0A8C5FYW1_GOUWI
IMRTPRILVFIYFLSISKSTVDCSLLSGPEVVKGTYSGSVTVACQYNLRYREYTKYWCKGPVYEICAIIVKTPKNRRNDRSFISDNKEAGVFTVTMTSLSESDTDMYWCVISRPGRNIYTRVKLLVSHEGKAQPFTTTLLNIKMSAFLTVHH